MQFEYLVDEYYIYIYDIDFITCSFHLQNRYIYNKYYDIKFQL